MTKLWLFTLPVVFNSSPPSAAYMRQWTGSSLDQVMACRLFSAKPLPEPMLVYVQLDSWEQVSLKFEWEFYNFYSRKCIWKCCLPKKQPFCPGGDELMVLSHIKFPKMLCHLGVLGCHLQPRILTEKGQAGSCKQLYLLYLPDQWNLPGTALLLSGFQSSQGCSVVSLGVSLSTLLNRHLIC